MIRYVAIFVVIVLIDYVAGCIYEAGINEGMLKPVVTDVRKVHDYIVNNPIIDHHNAKTKALLCQNTP